MSEIINLSGLSKNREPRDIGLPELFVTSEIISNQEKVYLALKQLTLEQNAIPGNQNTYKEVNSHLENLLQLWQNKALLVEASRNLRKHEWEKVADDWYLDDPNNESSKIRYSPKDHNDCSDSDDIFLNIANNSVTPYGYCSIGLNLFEPTFGLTMGDLKLIHEGARIRCMFSTSRFDGKHLYSVRLEFDKSKSGASAEISVTGNDEYELPIKRNSPPTVQSNFRLIGIKPE